MAGIQIRRINHVGLPIVDRRKSLPFYRDLLGLNVIPSMVDSPGVTWLQIADGAMVHPSEPRTDGNRIEFATLGGPPPANRVCDADGHTTVI
jgi:catechol 2,3-dioxygenase-like lactoylglutathione lyase family enzyme